MDRRKYLGLTVGAMASGIAGCSDSVPGGGTTENTESESGPIERTEYTDGTLEVGLVADHSVSALEFVHEDGSLITESSVGTQTSVEIRDMVGGPTGEHSIRAIGDDGDELDTVTVTYRPELTISGAEVDPGSAELTLQIENTGSGPARVTGLQSKYGSDPDEEGLLYHHEDEDRSTARSRRYPDIRNRYQGFQPVLTSLGGWDEDVIIAGGSAESQNVVEDEAIFRHTRTSYQVVPETQSWTPEIGFKFRTEPADLVPETKIELEFTDVVSVGERTYAADTGAVASIEAVETE